MRRRYSITLNQYEWGRLANMVRSELQRAEEREASRQETRFLKHTLDELTRNGWHPPVGAEVECSHEGAVMAFQHLIREMEDSLAGLIYYDSEKDQYIVGPYTMSADTLQELRDYYRGDPHMSTGELEEEISTKLLKGAE